MTPSPADQRLLADPERLEALERSGLLSKTMPERLEHLAFAACRLVLADACEINALTDVVQRTIVGWPPGDRPDRRLDETGCREPVLTRKPFIVDDAKLHPVTCELPWTDEFRGYLGVPIIVGEQVLGSLCVLSREPRRWVSYEVAALVGISRLIWMSLDV